MQNLLCLLLLTTTASSCVTIHDATVCSAAGKLSDGGICAHTLTTETYDLTFEQYVAFLEADEKKGAAVCLSTSDYGRMKTELESACRQLGSKCRYAVPKKPK